LESIKDIPTIASKGIKDALGKMNYAGYSNNMTRIASKLTVGYSFVMKHGTYIAAITKIRYETKWFVDDKIKQLEEKARKCQEENVLRQGNINENELNDFVDKTTEQWSQTLKTKIDTDVRTKLIEPIYVKVLIH
jgi:hypothetical protein